MTLHYVLHCHSGDLMQQCPGHVKHDVLWHHILQVHDAIAAAASVSNYLLYMVPCIHLHI